MKLTGMTFLGIGILLFVLGLCVSVGVIITNIPIIGWFAWIPMAVGGILIVVGIVLLVIKR